MLETAQSRCDEKRSSLLPGCVGTLFFCFSGGCCLYETAQSRCNVMKREVACPPVRHAHILQQLPNTGISRVTVYQQGRALPPKNVIPSTVKKLPSCCITAEISPADFSFTVSVKAVSVRSRNTVYRRKITIVSYHHRHNYRHILVLPFPSR